MIELLDRKGLLELDLFPLNLARYMYICINDCKCTTEATERALKPTWTNLQEDPITLRHKFVKTMKTCSNRVIVSMICNIQSIAEFVAVMWGKFTKKIGAQGSQSLAVGHFFITRWSY